MQSILNAHRKQIQIWNPHDLSFSWYILFLFYAFSFISSSTTKNITPNHVDSHLLLPLMLGLEEVAQQLSLSGLQI